jgi:hypothetical protein
MPSLEDVANELKSILEDVRTNTTTIKGHTSAIKNDVGTIINQLNHLDADLRNGFTNLAQGLQVLIALGAQENQLSAHNNLQNDTIICWLTNIANTLCDVKHNTDREVALQTDLSATLHHVDDIGELVHSREAVEVANRHELEERVDECCPPEKEPIKPCFNPCAAPRPDTFEPVKSDWKPIKYGGHDTPPG